MNKIILLGAGSLEHSDMMRAPVRQQLSIHDGDTVWRDHALLILLQQKLAELGVNAIMHAQYVAYTRPDLLALGRQEIEILCPIDSLLSIDSQTIVIMPNNVDDWLINVVLDLATPAGLFAKPYHNQLPQPDFINVMSPIDTTHNLISPRVNILLNKGYRHHEYPTEHASDPYAPGKFGVYTRKHPVAISSVLDSIPQRGHVDNSFFAT